MKAATASANESRERCFACDRPLGFGRKYRVDTRDAQTVFVGRDCFQLVRAAGDTGYQPPKGGPPLWLCEEPAK